MERKTFLMAGVLALAIVISGFIFAIKNQFLLSLFQVAFGGIIFWLVLRKAKKEPWFGKPVEKKA